MLQLSSTVDDPTDRMSDVDKELPTALPILGSSVSLSSTMERSLPLVWVYIIALQK